MSLLHHIATSPSTSVWLTVMVMVSHYHCCHEQLSHFHNVLQHTRPSTHLPTMETGSCPAGAAPPSPPARTDRYVAVDDYDPLSVLYRVVLSMQQEVEGGQQSEQSDEKFTINNSPQQPPQLKRVAGSTQLRYANVLLAAPPIVLCSMVLPSMYTR